MDLVITWAQYQGAPTWQLFTGAIKSLGTETLVLPQRWWYKLLSAQTVFAWRLRGRFIRYSVQLHLGERTRSRRCCWGSEYFFFPLACFLKKEKKTDWKKTDCLCLWKWPAGWQAWSDPRFGAFCFWARDEKEQRRPHLSTSWCIWPPFFRLSFQRWQKQRQGETDSPLTTAAVDRPVTLGHVYFLLVWMSFLFNAAAGTLSFFFNPSV